MRAANIRAKSAPDNVAKPEPAGSYIDDVHPYFAFEPPEFLDHIARELPYFDTPEAEETLDIVLLGGSVAAQFTNLGRPHLVELLEADPRLAGRKVKFFAHPRAGHKEPQQVNMLNFLLCLGYRPDGVINLDGFNEVALPQSNARTDTHPLYPSAGQWASLVRGTHLDRDVLDLMLDVRERETRTKAIAKTWNRWGLFASAVAGRFGLSRAHRLRNESAELQNRVVEGIKAGDRRRVLLGPVFDRANVMELAVRAWSEGSRSLHALCRERGILYIHALQPTLHDKGSKPLSAAEIRTGAAGPRWVEGVSLGYPRLREAGAELTQLGVHFLDCSMVFRESTDDFYFDNCHFNEGGHLLIAEAIAPFMLDCLGVEGAAVSGAKPARRSR